MFRRTLSFIILALSFTATAAMAQDKPAQAGSAADQAANIPAVSASPSFEVASIKPWDGTGFGIRLLVYIQSAFGVPANSNGLLIGPDWINNARYVIQTKPPDSIRDAMQKMTADEKRKITGQMQQSLLADRFKLKAHFETREMPEYELVVAKGGLKLKENPDTSQSGISVGSSAIKGTAVSVPMLVNMLMAAPDIGGRVVINKTGLTGRYEVSLKWTPISSASPGNDNGAAPSADADTVSLFTAIEEQLGLKLVPTKGQGQVLIIDHIERPSAN